MSNFDKPIFRQDQTGIEKPNSIPEIEPNKSPSNKSPHNNQTIPESIVSNFLIIKSILSCVDFFLDKTSNNKKKLNISPEHLLRSLLEFKKNLNLLENIDCWNDVDFIQNLSENWNNLLASYTEISSLKLLSQEAVKKLDELILDISEHPRQSDHTLGFYLTERAGVKWAPVPLIQILKSLHELHQNNSDQSILRKWSLLTADILSEVSESTNN